MPVARLTMLLGKLLRQCTKRPTLMEPAPRPTHSDDLTHFRLLAENSSDVMSRSSGQTGGPRAEQEHRHC